MQIKSSERCVENFFKINGCRYVLNVDDFTVPKIVLHNEIIYKTRIKKENSAHRRGDIYI